MVGKVFFAMGPNFEQTQCYTETHTNRMLLYMSPHTLPTDCCSHTLVAYYFWACSLAPSLYLFFSLSLSRFFAMCAVCVFSLLPQPLQWPYCSSAFFFFIFNSLFYRMPFLRSVRWAAATLPCSQRRWACPTTLPRSSWSTDFSWQAHQLIPKHGANTEWVR